jgi:hypothetical protein
MALELRGPAGLVNSGFNTHRSYTDNSFSTAQSTIEKIEGLASDIEALQSTASFGDIELPNTNISVGTPVTPDLSFLSKINLDNVPGLPSVFIPTLNFDTAPTFTATAPDINLPSSPNPLDVAVPVNNYNIETSFNFPSAPTSTLPEVPDLRELTLPEEPGITLPTLNADSPEFSLGNPTNNFNFVETPYTSTLLDNVSQKLIDRLTGGTGLPADVEEALWNRGRDRESRASVQAKQELYNDHASKGWSLPSGILDKRVQEAVQESQNNNNTLSREIMIEQARLEQENLKQTIGSILQLESTLISAHQQEQQRALEAERLEQQFFIDVYNLYIQKYNLDLDKYRVQVEAFNRLIEAELSKLEIYKSKLEAQRIIGSLNEQDIQIYRGKLDALRTEADVYRTQVQGVQTRLEAERTKLDIFRTEVETYTAQVQAKRSEYENYATEIRGELAKTDIYKAQVDAFTSRIQAYAAETDAKSNQLNSYVEKGRYELDAYRARLSAIETEASNLVRAAQVENDKYRSYINRFDFLLRKETAQATDQHESVRDRLKEQQARALFEERKVEFNIEQVLKSRELQLSSLESIAQVSSQLASASMAAINLGASVSGQDSYTEYHYYQEK